MATSEESAGDGPDGRDRILNELEAEVADSIREDRPPEIGSDGADPTPEPSGDTMELAGLNERLEDQSDLQKEVRDRVFEDQDMDPGGR
jgi:hypothetical protein